MSLPLFLRTVIAALGFTASVLAVDTRPPNIVLIFIDDLGYADIGPFGNTEVRTPNLDNLAKQGRKFTSYYATPVCTMSRASLMTGCHNTRISLPGVLFPNAKIGLNLAETTMAEVLKTKGYATICIGKWHLGDAKEFLPTRQGFDEYFGLPYSNDMGGARKNNPPLPLYRGETVIETEPDQSQLTRRYTEEAVKFIQAKKDQPFFLYLPHTMVHHPLAASENFKGKSKFGFIGDTIEEIDWSVGQILTALDELNLANNTLVIFTSDNGADNRPCPPFRGSKASSFEGGVREPCLMRWPGKIPAGTTCDQILGNIDLLPTFAKISGATLDPERVIDGKDVTSLLTETSPAAVRDSHLYFSGGESQLVAIRQGDWKLFVALKDPKTPVPQGTLYNLKTDPGETADVASAHPDIVARLKEEAEKRNAEILAHKRPAGTTAVVRADELTPLYETRTEHDSNGIGKFFMGREIAHVMGHQAADWLERPQREDEERTDLLIEALKLREGEVVADIGCGSGFISRKIARKIGKTGVIHGVEIQQEMLDLLMKRMAHFKIDTVRPVLGTTTDPKLPPGSCDTMIMVDVYHEFDFPFEMIRNMLTGLNKGGRIVFVEYRKEDPAVPIKEVHKMSEAQVKKEMTAHPQLDYAETIGTLPRQHIIIFRKK